jgi:hypothetical protein
MFSLFNHLVRSTNSHEFPSAKRRHNRAFEQTMSRMTHWANGNLCGFVYCCLPPNPRLPMKALILGGAKVFLAPNLPSVSERPNFHFRRV